MSNDDTQFIEGRSRKTALRLLQLAEELGYTADDVRAVSGGYRVPTTVAEAFIENPTYEGDDPFVDASYTPVQTNHEPLTFDTSFAASQETPAGGLNVLSADADTDTAGIDGAQAAQEATSAGADDEVSSTAGQDDGDGVNSGTDEVPAAGTELTDEEKQAAADNLVPAKSASKGDWLAYARTQGFDGADDDLTKDELIAKYGA